MDEPPLIDDKTYHTLAKHLFLRNADHRFDKKDVDAIWNAIASSRTAKVNPLTKQLISQKIEEKVFSPRNLFAVIPLAIGLLMIWTALNYDAVFTYFRESVREKIKDNRPVVIKLDTYSVVDPKDSLLELELTPAELLNVGEKLAASTKYCDKIYYFTVSTWLDGRVLQKPDDVYRCGSGEETFISPENSIKSPILFRVPSIAERIVICAFGFEEKKRAEKSNEVKLRRFYGRYGKSCQTLEILRLKLDHQKSALPQPSSTPTQSLSTPRKEHEKTPSE